MCDLEIVKNSSYRKFPTVQILIMAKFLINKNNLMISTLLCQILLIHKIHTYISSNKKKDILYMRMKQIVAV